MRVRRGTLSSISEFWRQRRLAVAGVSRGEGEYGRTVFRQLVSRGYDVVPLNPAAAEIDGVRCYPSVGVVLPRVDAVLVLLPVESAIEVVNDCVRAGVKRVWLRTDVPGARELCERQGIELVSGYCPMMFLQNGSFIHQCHALGLRLVGAYPS